MKIIVLGAGQVGITVATTLVRENNDVTIVDKDSATLHDIAGRLDLRTVHGNAAHPDILKRAGADDADMVVAATSSDEVNMIACQVAYTLYHTPTKIARIRAQVYLHEGKLYANDNIPIDHIISPEQLITDHVSRLIQYPGSLQVIDFAQGRVRLVAVRAYQGGPLVGKMLSQLRERFQAADTRVAAIYRKGQGIVPTADTRVEAYDEIFFVTSADKTLSVMKEIKRMDKPTKRVMIAGGGNTGRSVAKALESHYKVKLIEKNPARALDLAEDLDKTLILKGDTTDRELLIEEGIENVDVFCALTNDDEDNILSAMLAKKMGADRVISLIARPAYVDLIQQDMIDIAVSPQQVTISALLTHIRRGDIVAVHSLRHGAAEAIEAIAHGDYRTSKVVGRRIDELPLPTGASIGAIVRDDKVMIARRDIKIEEGDHVIMFLIDKTKVREVERLFQVGLTFI